MSEKKVDPEAALHRRQLDRVDELVRNVHAVLRYNVYMAKVMYSICHIAAIVSWASGVSIVGTTWSGTALGQWLTTLLGCLSAVYPLLKYIDLEGKRGEYQRMVKFCSSLKDRLEDTAERMRGILESGFDAEDERKKWAEFVVFINATKRLLEAFELGVEDVQKDLHAFHELETKLQKDAAGFPLQAARAFEEDNSPVRKRPVKSKSTDGQGSPSASDKAQ